MLIEVIACDTCRTILGPPAEYDVPSVAPSDVFDAENETVERDFADGWKLFVYPAPSDPIALSQTHRCPSCRTD